MYEVKIVEVIQRKKDLIFKQKNLKGIEISKLLFPEEDDEIEFKFNIDESFKIKYRYLNNIFSQPSLREKYVNSEYFIQALNEDEDNIRNISEIVSIENIPYLNTFFDITDKEFNGFDEIDENTLKSSGMWIGIGKRIIEFKIKESLISILRKGEKVNAKLYFNKIDNNYLENPIEFRVETKRNDNKHIVYLDTDKFLDYLEESKLEVDLEGFLEFEIEKIIDDDSVFIISYPVSIKIKNPQPVNDVVAIDFGTSSTCVSYDGGKKLIAFSDNPENIEDYENLSAMIIFNWEKIYNQWVKDVNLPHFIRSSNSAEKVDYKKEHYNYSSYIRDEFKEVPSVKVVDAVIKDLKTLPSLWQKDRENLPYFKPYDNFKNKVFLDLEENEEKLNPIAMYGYLIGRNINLFIRNRVYLNYILTVPVNFSEEEKNIIKDSLEKGIKKSVPKRLREKVKVEIKYEEPVAILGSAKKLKHFQLNKTDKDAILFSVFDFGGGTLDFVFGLFRKSKKENGVIEDEFKKFKNVIEIFKTDGMRIGGERLIERLSYKIYKYNQDKMREYNIPILVPDNEERIENFPQKLFGNRHVDRVNLMILNEKISREFFINGNVTYKEVALLPLDDEDREERIELEINEDDLNEFLENEIYLAVEYFKDVLERTFKSNLDILSEYGYEEFDIKDVKIFQAGNTSKHFYVKQAFEKLFKDNDVIFLEDDEEVEEIKKITVKNTVARGALFLKGTGVYYHNKNEGKLPLDRYIWNIENLEDGDEEPLFEKGDIKDEFKYLGRRDGNEFILYYSDVLVEDEDDDNLKALYIDITHLNISDGQTFVFVKPLNKNCVLVSFSEDMDDCNEEDNCYVLDLESGEIKEYI